MVKLIFALHSVTKAPKKETVTHFEVLLVQYIIVMCLWRSTRQLRTVHQIFLHFYLSCTVNVYTCNILSVSLYFDKALSTFYVLSFLLYVILICGNIIFTVVFLSGKTWMLKGLLNNTWQISSLEGLTLRYLVASFSINCCPWRWPLCRTETCGRSEWTGLNKI